jgi:hypothetical protein
MRLAELKAAELSELSVLLGSNFFIQSLICFAKHTVCSVNKMTIIGEMYQVDGTSTLAYCRSKRVITQSTECYSGSCRESICGNTEEQNTLYFYSYNTIYKGLNYLPAIPEDRFICEEP